jgi:uncharacterized membrane protein
VSAVDTQEVSRDHRLLAALAYPFWVLAFIVLNLSPELRRVHFLRFHVYQAFFLGLALWLGGVVLHLIAALLGKYLVVLGLLLYPLVRLAHLASVIFTGCCAYQAWKGVLFRIPGIYPYARPFIEETPSEPPQEPSAGTEETRS